MRVSEFWLREWIDFSIDTNKLVDILTNIGLEVKSVFPVSSGVSDVKIVKVIDIIRHPKKNGLIICKLQIDKNFNIIQVVCKISEKIYIGSKVACALVGSKLLNKFIIKEDLIFGEISQGVLCTYNDLNFYTKSYDIDELLILNETAPIGADLCKYLLLKDNVLDITLNFNRTDCFSVLGIAREISSFMGTPIKNFFSNLFVKKDINEKLNIYINDFKYCPIYNGRIIRDINCYSYTPDWIKERLNRSDIKIVSPVVDIINYVVLEIGIPIFYFDLDLIHENSIVIRLSYLGEQFESFDGKKIILDDKTLVMCSNNKILALPGLIHNSSVCFNKNVKNLFFSNFFLDPNLILSTSKKYSIYTEYSQRFSRGIDYSLLSLSLERVSDLLKKILGGSLSSVFKVANEKFFPSRKKIFFNFNNFKKLIGFYLSENKVTNILRLLNMALLKKSDICWIITVPIYRFDIELEIDLIEEIVRYYGYNKIIGKKIVSLLKISSIDPIDLLSKKCSLLLVNRGYSEVINYSFVDPILQNVLFDNKKILSLVNPMSEKSSHMRISLWPGLIISVKNNILRKEESIKLFETGIVFSNNNGCLKEKFCISGLLLGKRNSNLSWKKYSEENFDFYDIKGDLELIFSILNIKNVYFVSFANQALHPCQSVKIVFNSDCIGWCGKLNPYVANMFSLPDGIILFELFLEKIKKNFTFEPKKYKEFSKFPKISRDLSFLVDKNMDIHNIENILSKLVKFRNVVFFGVCDIYVGKLIPSNKKSITISFVFQRFDRTMTDSEINDTIDFIVKFLEKEYSIVLRYI
ncbi:phenylalanine--tRNA ligase subunit beta [Candidatus Legionella polyplacis]|uniref:Phenylalanine--tRNA ligase beta subunit n=1 Tax=Candidatus Legionella polyplacis TaxID=2005262 RepID=A0ABZ2GWD5_9GAMM